MADHPVDPMTPTGEALRRWYLRSPAEVEREREAAKQKRYDAYFGGGRSAAPAEDLTELRRQQAEFKKTQRAIGNENAWMAIPALAPAAAVMGLEGAAYIAGRLAPAAVQRAPLALEKADPYLRVGDNWATRAGRRAHDALRERVAQKPGWKPEPTLKMDDGRILRPDVRTPPRARAPGEDPAPFQMELKPNTPSGRAAAARAVKKYEPTKVKTRPIFYDPKDFL